MKVLKTVLTRPRTFIPTLWSKNLAHPSNNTQLCGSNRGFCRKKELSKDDQITGSRRNCVPGPIISAE